MNVKTSILIAVLVSVVNAGPAKWQRESCASECVESEKYFYEIGRIYEYKYETETLTSLIGIPGIDEAQTKVTAKVFIQPVSSCEQVLTLKDVSLEGSANSDEFAAQITKNTLRFSYQNGKVETICGSEEEPLWVLNFKKGILSAIQNSMETLEGHETITELDILGKCETSYSAKKDGSSILIEKTKYPSKCSNSVYGSLSKLNTLGYATETLLQGLSIVKSEQVCSQKISDEIIKSVTCTETHTLKPFSKGQSAQTKVILTLDLVSVKSSLPPITGAIGLRTGLNYENTETESQNDILESAEEILNQLEFQTSSGITKEVPGLFSELVMALRNLEKHQIQNLYDNKEGIAKKFIIDSLLLGKTPATTSMIVSLIKEDKISTADKSAWITSLAFMKNPSLEMFSAIQPILETQDGSKVQLALSTLVYNYCNKDSECTNKDEIVRIIRSMESYLGVGCRATSEEEKENILIALKSLGNIGKFVNAETILRRCYTEENAMEIRVAAIEAWRRTHCAYDRDHLKQAFNDRSQDNEIRIASYLAIMKCPTKEIIEDVKDILTSEGINHVSSFVWYHLSNLAESAFPEKKLVGELIREEMLQKKFSEDNLKLSRNFESSFFLTEDNIGGMAEGNLIFGSDSFLPRSTMFNVSIDMFGETVNLFEIGGRIEGFEKYMSKFFGPDGYYPQETVEAILKNLEQQHSEENALDSYMTPNDDPQGSYYLKIFGNELFYKHFHGISDIFPSLDINKPMDLIKDLLTKGEVDYLKNFNIINTEFSFPTIAGLPINLKLSGVASVGFKLNGHFDFQNFKTIDIQGTIQPSASVKFDASMTVDSFVTKSGIKMISTMHSSTLIDGSVVVQDGKIIDVTVNVPKDKMEIYEISHDLIKIENGMETNTRPNVEYEPTRYVEFLGMSMTYGHMIDSTTFDSVGRKMIISKADTHSSYKLQFKNEPKIMLLSFDMPGSKQSKKWLLSLKHGSNVMEIDLETPYASAKADMTYKLTPSEVNIKGSIDINNVQKYSTELAFTNENGKGVNLIEFKILLADFQKELININLQSKINSGNSAIAMNAASSGVFVPTISAKLDVNLKENNNEVSIAIKSTPVDISLSGSIKPVNGKTSINMEGKCRLFDNEPKTITALSTYNLEMSEEGTGIFEGNLRVKELGFEANWDTQMNNDLFDSKISGKYGDSIFNIDHSYVDSTDENSRERSIKSLVHIPALNFDYMLKKSLIINPEKCVYEFATKFGEYFHSNIIGRWTINKEIYLSKISQIGEHSSNFKFNAVKLTPNSYKIEVAHIMNAFTNQGVLTWNKSPERFFAKLDSSWHRNAIPYALKWDINADKTELNMEGSFNRNDELSTIFAKVTTKSLNISNTFYKPLSIDANMDIEGTNKKVLITASSEEAAFRVAFSVTPDHVKGEIKFGETDVGMTARYQPSEIEMEAWWSPVDKIRIQGSYEFGQNGNVMVSIETPFQDWEKQDATLTYKGAGIRKQGQLSFTWANSQHFTITGELKTDLQKSDISGSIRATSTLPAVDRIQLSTNLNFKDKIDFEIEGICNSNEMKGTFKAYPYENAYKATAKFTSTFTEDFNANFSHSLSFKDIATNLQIIYGSQVTKITLKGSIMNKTNLKLNFLCQSPFLPEIMLNGVMETSSSLKVLELKGMFNKEKFMVFGNCEHQESTNGLVCKYNLRIDAVSKSIINVSFVYERNIQNQFKSDININSELITEYAIKGHIEGKISSFSSVLLNGFISGPKFNGRINIKHELIGSSIDSVAELAFNNFNVIIETNGNIDINQIVGSLKSKIESSCPFLNGYQINLEHSQNYSTRKTILVVSKGSSNYKIEHSIQILNAFNWSNRLIFNEMYGIDNTMSSPSNGVYKHESKVTFGDKSIELMMQLKMDNDMELQCSLNSPWTSYLKLTANHQSIGSSKQSKIKFEYGQGKVVEIDSDYSIEKYNKHLNLSVVNEEWWFTPIKAEIKVSTEEKKSFEFFLTATNVPSILFKASKHSDTKKIKLEVSGSQKYSIECEMEGDQKEGRIQTKVFLPIMGTPLKSELTHKIESLSFADFALKFSFEDSADNYKLELNLREEKINLKYKGPNKEGSLLFSWKYEEAAGKLTMFMKLISPCSLIKDSTVDIIIYKDLETAYKTVTVNYGLKKYTFTLKHGPCPFKYFELTATTPIQGWEELYFSWNFKDTKITGVFSRNTMVYKIAGHANANFQKGEAELSVITPIVGYENNKVYIQHSFMASKGNMFFSSEVGSSKISIEYNANIIDRTHGDMTFSIVTPFEGIEKLSLKVAFKDAMFKLTGIYNKSEFEWILKTFYEGKAKAKFSLNLTSNISGWTSFEITGDLKFSQTPYFAALNIVKENQITTYSISANFDSESFNFEAQLPIEKFEKIKVNGKFYRENGYFKTYFSCGNSISEINFSGYASINGEIPDIKMKLLTPFEGKENIEFTMNGTISSDKSISVALAVGKKQYLVSVYIKSEGRSGKIAADIKLPLFGFDNFTFSSLYNFVGNTKTAKVNFIWNDSKFILASKINNAEIDLDIESSDEEFKSFHVSGQHKKINNGYIGFGKISKNGMDYKFEGKAILEENEFTVDVKIPSESYSTFSVKGAFIDNSITFKVTEGTNSMKSYDFQISYSLTPSEVFLNIATPFEFFSFGEVSYIASANKLSGHITLKKFSQIYQLETEVEISLMKSNMEINIEIPTTRRSIKFLYDIQSEEKCVKALYDTGSTINNFSLQVYFAPTTLNNGYIKFASTYPDYEEMGLEYNFKWWNLNDVDTFVSIYKNKNTTTFGVKTAFEVNKVICKFVTPFAGYEMIGFEAVKDEETNQRTAILMTGNNQISLKYNFSFGNYFITIETPFESFKILDIAAKSGWEKNNKYGLIKFVFNEIKYELSSDIKLSWMNPKIKFTFVTPIEAIPAIKVISEYNIEEPNKAFEFGIQLGDWIYWTSGKFGLLNQGIFLNIELKSPIEGWKYAKFAVDFGLSDDDKLIKISLEKENSDKLISILGKLTDEEMQLEIINPIDTIPNFETSASRSRSKRSLMMNDHHLPLHEIWESFQSFKVKITSPFEKAKEVNFEIVKGQGAIKLHYKRNDNFVDFELDFKKKKGFGLTIKSALPGWELLAITGRLSTEDLKAYISGQKNEKKMEITGTGSFTDNTGSMKIDITTPYEKFKTVAVNLDYNSRRNIITFHAKSDSSDFNILLEFKKALTIDVFIPHPQQNTVAKGKLTLFNGDFTASSRFPILKTVSLKYSLVLGAIVTGKVEYMRNGVKAFEVNLESNGNEDKLHLEIHVRLFGNHSMLHIHRDGWKHLEFVAHRNDEEFKVTLHGSGALPKSGTVQFTIDNSFREIPKHITGSLQIDRNASPRKVILQVEMPGKKLYSANLNYNTDLQNLKKGDFTLSIQTPQRDMRPWKKISGNWNVDKRVITATINVGPIQYQLNGKIGLKESSLVITANDKDSTKYFVEWKCDRQVGLRDYYIKIGKHDRYVMAKLHGTFDTIKNADVQGAFRISRFMNKDYMFSEKYTTDASGKVTGSGTFEFGAYKGTSQYTFTRNAEEKAVKLTTDIQSNIPNLNKVTVNLDYNIKRRMIDLLLKWDNDKLSVKGTFDNFKMLTSSNVIKVHLPKLGAGEITVSHDFTNPLSKSFKAVGKIGNKNISYVAQWTRNADLTVFDFNYNIDSAILGKASLHADFDVTNLQDAKANLKYKRNQDKFVTIAWTRKRSATHIENDMTFKSHFAILPTARFHVTADWSKGFKLDEKLEWRDKSIEVHVLFTANKATATVTTPFEKFGNIVINLEYSFKPKEITIAFKYARGSQVVDFSYNLQMQSKKAGSLKMSLTTPFPVIQKVIVDGSWKKGVFTATYKRNDDVVVNFEGTADVKLEKSSLDIKFTPPNKGPVVVKFAYDLDKFVEGTGKKAAKLIDLHVEVAGETINFSVDGFRSEDKIFVEVNGSTTLEKLSTLYLKLDSELNITHRVGFFEIKVNNFHLKVKNEFEKRKNGFYLRSQMESSATPLPGLTLGFGKEGDAFIATIGYGDEREISISFKGKEGFKKGFSGKIDIPRRGINDLQYDVTYGFKSNDKLSGAIKIKLAEGRIIEADLTYNSQGVKARLLTPWTGEHSARMRRSITDDYFMTDVGFDDMGFTLEGKSINNFAKKGFKLDGEIFGKKIFVDCFFNNGIENLTGKAVVRTPFSGFEILSGTFMMDKTNKLFSANGNVDFIRKLAFDLTVDLNGKIKGNGYLSVDDRTYEFMSNLLKAGSSYEGSVSLYTPHTFLSKVTANGFFEFSSFPNMRGSFKLQINDKTYDVNLSHAAKTMSNNLDITYLTSDLKEVKIMASYSLTKTPIIMKFGLSKNWKNVQIYNINFNLKANSPRDIDGNLEISIPKYSTDISSQFLSTVNSITADISAKILKEHEFMFKLNIPSTSTREIILNINTPYFPKSSIKLTKNFNESVITLEGSFLTKSGTYSIAVNYDNSIFQSSIRGTGLLEIEIIEPNIARRHYISIKVTRDNLNYVADMNIQCGATLHTFEFRNEVLESNMTFEFSAKTPILYYGFAKISISLNFNDDIQVLVNSLINEKTHSGHFRFDPANQSFVGIIESPLMFTGIGKLEASATFTSIMDAKLYFLFSDTKNTFSTSLKLKLLPTENKEISFEMKTPFTGMKKMKFSVEYSNEEINRFAISASPLALEAQCFFGVVESVFNAGIEIKTPIKNWELTEAKAIIPLNTFAPKIEATVYGIQYGLESKINESATGGELMVKGFVDKDISEIFVGVRTQVPYEVRAKSLLSCLGEKNINFGIIFDSSFLYLFQEMLI